MARRIARRASQTTPSSRSSSGNDLPSGPGRRRSNVARMSGILVAAVMSTMHYEGDVPAVGGDYQDVAIQVPAGTAKITLAHSDGSDCTILEWGVWGPDGYRGWGG